MGGFLGIGGSSAKTDRGNQLGGLNAAWNIYNRGLPIADKAMAAGGAVVDKGLDTLGDAKNFWRSITQGIKPAVSKPMAMQEAAPAIDAINNQSDANRVEQANMGTSRGGGATAINLGAETERMAETDKAISGATTAAGNRTVAGASGLQQVGETEADFGHKQIAEAFAALGLSKQTADEIIDSSIKSRPVSMAANAEVRQQWSNALAALGL